MADEMAVALSERERFTLTMFFGGTYKPRDKKERKAMRLAYKRLRLDEVVARLRAPGGVNATTLKDTPEVVPINEETVNWVRSNLNATMSETLDSLILSDLEDRFDALADGTYKLPATKPALASVPPDPAPSAPEAS